MGSLFSINVVSEDLEAGFKAVLNWVAILKSFNYHFRIRLFVHRWIRSIKKKPKLYHWDWLEVADPGARFENLVAGHVLERCHFLRDRDGFAAELSFLREWTRRKWIFW